MPLAYFPNDIEERAMSKDNDLDPGFIHPSGSGRMHRNGPLLRQHRDRWTTKNNKAAHLEAVKRHQRRKRADAEAVQEREQQSADGR